MKNWQQYATNCDKLAAFLEGLPEQEYDQSCVYRLFGTEGVGICGSVGCAWGYAAVSGLFEGLEMRSGNKYPMDQIVVYNGKIVPDYDFIDQASKVFGPSTYQRVFSAHREYEQKDINLSERQVSINRLRELSEEYRSWAKA